MRNLVRFTLKQAVFINIVFVILMVGGVYALLTTPVENLPPVDIGKVFITTVYYGASAEDVEQLVTREIEDALEGLENVEYIQSRSMRNVSSVLLKFEDDTDYRTLYDELRLRVLNIRNQLPQAVDDPVFTYLDTKTWIPVIVANITGELSNRSLKRLAEELQSELEALDGVQEAEIDGDYTQEFQVRLDPDRLRRQGITFAEVCQAISRANQAVPSGRYRHQQRNLLLDTGETFHSQQGVLDVAVRLDTARQPVRVRDLAVSAQLGYRDPDIISSVNGRSTIRLKVNKENRANSVHITRQVKKLAADFDRRHQTEGISTVLTYDSTIEIDDSVRTLGGNMVLGMLLVSLILWLTLGFRNALLTAIGIPFSFLATLILIKLTGHSINTISLFSFVLVSGIIVDDAVIMVENVYRHLHLGKPRRAAVIDGVSEVFLPVVSSALTTILAFIPMLIMTGSTGEFFSVIPKAVSFALFASLMEALFILPVHILDYGPRQYSGPIEDDTDFHHLLVGPFAPLWRTYRALLDSLLGHKVLGLLSLTLVFLMALAIMGVSISGLAPLVKIKFFQDSYLRYHVAVEMPTGTAVEGTDRVVRDLSRYLLALGPGQTKAVSGSAGYLEDRDYAVHRAQHYGQVVVTLPTPDERQLPADQDNIPAYIDSLYDRLQTYADAQATRWGARPVLKVFGENTGPPTGKAVNIRLSATAIDAAVAASDLLLKWMRSEPELASLINLEDDRAANQEVLQFRVQSERALEYRLPQDEAARLVAGALTGYPVGNYRTIDDEIDLMVRLARQEEDGETGLYRPEEVLRVPMIEHGSGPIRLGDLVTLSHEAEADTLTRYNGRPTITLSADIRDGSNLSASRVQRLTSRHFRTLAEQMPGVTIDFGGEFESTGRAYRSLAAAFLIAVLAIYLVLATQFNDYLQPLIILSAIAFAIIGVVFGLLFTRSVFTISSFMAVIGLAGVAVNDSLILIDFMNKQRERGLGLREAVISACSARMRPVLITTVTTMLGMLPMAIGIPHKSITWAPMATAFATGLASATLLTLVMIPVEYELLEQWKNRQSVRGWKRKRATLTGREQTK
ncbi:MAG: efflux RND transporter permease subunit [Desulfuromonadaceae bacterium]|nr:efflux RND transporter permease subunit [Desulfuromonadaceae bacterium]